MPGGDFVFPNHWNWMPIDEPPSWNMGLFPRVDPDPQEMARELREALDSGKDPQNSAADVELKENPDEK